MLQIDNLSVYYGKHQALRDISLNIKKGELVVILGANGAGKSTLLKTISGICEGKISGEILLSNDSILNLKPESIVEKGIALVPEGRAIFGDLSVFENLKLGAFSERAQTNIHQNLTLVHELFPKLKERANQIARTMSGGEQQMVAIGRAIMSSPDILMLDEPSLGLSPLLSKELFTVLGKIRDRGIGVLVLEQNAKLSLSIADRGYLFEVGKLVGQDTAKNLINNPNIKSAYLGDNHRSSLSSKSSGNSNGQKKSFVPFIEPLGLNLTHNKNHKIENTSINELVSNAQATAKINRNESSQRNFNRILIKQPDQENKINHLNKEQEVGKLHVEGKDHSSQCEIEALLRDFEEAATKARIPEKETRNISKEFESMNLQEKLPKIPVFRNSEVKVFKRDSSGLLQQIHDLKDKGD